MDQQLQDNLGQLLAKVGPVGALVLLIILWINTDKKIRKEIRSRVWMIVRWAVKKIWYLITVAWWAVRNGIPFRLALRLQPDRWDAMVEKRRMPGLKRGKVRRIPIGVSVRLTLTGSLTAKYVSKMIHQLETGLGLKRGTARLRNPSRSDHLILEIKLREPAEGRIPWDAPRGKVRLADPVRVSVTEFGDPVTVSLKNRVGLFGESGSGKSCVQRVLGAHVIQAVDAGLEIWDLKQGVESQHYAGKARRVTTVEQALERLDWLQAVEFPRRAAVMKQQGVSQWRESDRNPALVIFVDEGNVITRGFKAGQFARLATVIEQGRALGVYFVWATQYPKADNLPTEIRSQLNITICLKLTKPVESRVVFDPEDVSRGWAPHALRGVGWCLVMISPKDDPVESKAVWLDEDDFRELELVGRIPGGSEQPGEPEPEPDVDPVEAEKTYVADDVREALLISESPLGISELARRTGRSKSGVSDALKKLTAEGAVRREGDLYLVPTKGEA